MFVKPFYLLTSCLWLLCSSNSHPAKVYFIPTLHGLHKVNKNYSYDSLKQIVADIKPDIIVVEIRQEDIGRDSVYLSKHYPYEMRMMQSWFPDKKIAGFDWLGDDIKNRPMPENYWKEISAIKQFERELERDPIFLKKAAACDTFTKQRMDLLQHYSLRDILKSNDHQLVTSFYRCLEDALTGSRHERLLQFYSFRNVTMQNNIRKIIAGNKGKRIVILTGDDHYPFLKSKFKSEEIFIKK